MYTYLVCIVLVKICSACSSLKASFTNLKVIMDIHYVTTYKHPKLDVTLLCTLKLKKKVTHT